MPFALSSLDRCFSESVPSVCSADMVAEVSHTQEREQRLQNDMWPYIRGKHRSTVRRRMATDTVRGALGKFIGSMESVRRKWQSSFSRCHEVRDRPRRREKSKSRRVRPSTRLDSAPDQNVSQRVKHSHLETTSHRSHSTSIAFLVSSLIPHTAKI
jgi:hypothetical protein